MEKTVVGRFGKYSIVDSSESQREFVQQLTSVVGHWGKKMFDGVCLNQYGENPVRFIEVIGKNGPIVGAIKQLAAMRGLYPAYIVDEVDNKVDDDTQKWYRVDQCSYQLQNVNKDSFHAWKENYKLACKLVYRECHVFIKTFCYLDGDVLNVVTFNTERHPRCGTAVGIPEWRHAMSVLNEHMEKELGYKPSCFEMKKVLYTNL